MDYPSDSHPSDSNYLLFQRAFLMTFKSFTTVDEFFDLLVARFWIEPPPGLSSQELESWTKQKQRVIQARWGVHVFVLIDCN